MTPNLGLYSKLPYPLKVVAASFHGFHLKRERYSLKTGRIVEQALEREMWSVAQWKRWREERLAYILHRAATKVPYYMEHWQERRRKGDRSTWDTLENWPLLDKETLRRRNLSFVAEDCDIRKMYPDHTSGTTGTPLTIWLSRSTVQEWYGINEARVRKWFGVSIKQPWGIFGGQVVIPVAQKKPPYWVKNFALNQIYFSIRHIKPHTYQAYLKEIIDKGLTHLIVYTSSLYYLASLVPTANIPIQTKLKVIIANAEPLSDIQRKKISGVFGCPVKETYGLAEVVCAASECESGSLHWWPEIGLPEILDEEGKPTAPGKMGRLISTGLLNADMPLIRYDTRDLITRVSQDDHCECGRTLPIAGKIVGRVDDIIMTPDGPNFTQVDTIFDPHLPLKEAQIIQNTLNDFVIRVVPDGDWAAEHSEYLVNELKKRIGNINVKIVKVDEVERTESGKNRLLVSNLPKKTDNK